MTRPARRLFLDLARLVMSMELNVGASLAEREQQEQ